MADARFYAASQDQSGSTISTPMNAAGVSGVAGARGRLLTLTLALHLALTLTLALALAPALALALTLALTLTAAGDHL